MSKILVVDDEPGIRETMRDILILEGYEVDTAECGEQAVAKCADGHYDFVLLDVYMPGMNGLETLREINRVSSDTRTIMITGYDPARIIDQAMNEGAEAVFRKPLNVAMFLPLLMA